MHHYVEKFKVKEKHFTGPNSVGIRIKVENGRDFVRAIFVPMSPDYLDITD